MANLLKYGYMCMCVCVCCKWGDEQWNIWVARSCNFLTAYKGWGQLWTIRSESLNSIQYTMDYIWQRQIIGLRAALIFWLQKVGTWTLKKSCMMHNMQCICLWYVWLLQWTAGRRSKFYELESLEGGRSQLSGAAACLADRWAAANMRWEGNTWQCTAIKWEESAAATYLVEGRWRLSGLKLLQQLTGGSTQLLQPAQLMVTMLTF